MSEGKTPEEKQRQADLERLSQNELLSIWRQHYGFTTPKAGAFLVGEILDAEFRGKAQEEA